MDSSRPLRSRRKDAKRPGPEEGGIRPLCVFPGFCGNSPSAPPREPVFFQGSAWNGKFSRRGAGAHRGRNASSPPSSRLGGLAALPLLSVREGNGRKKPRSLKAANEGNGVASINCTFQTFGSRASRCIVGKCIIFRRDPIESPSDGKGRPDRDAERDPPGPALGQFRSRPPLAQSLDGGDPFGPGCRSGRFREEPVPVRPRHRDAATPHERTPSGTLGPGIPG